MRCEGWAREKGAIEQCRTVRSHTSQLRSARARQAGMVTRTVQEGGLERVVGVERGDVNDAHQKYDSHKRAYAHTHTHVQQRSARVRECRSFSKAGNKRQRRVCVCGSARTRDGDAVRQKAVLED